MGRPNREILTGGQKYKEKRTAKNRVGEVTFDSESRTSYLTGFHKRKVERKKNAQKHAQEMAKKERIEERARIREERQEQVRKKLEEMKAAMELNPFLKREEQEEAWDGEEEEEDEKEEEEEGEKKKKSVGWGESDEEDEVWGGIKEDEEEGTGDVKSILKKQVYEIDNADAPVVGHSEVVIESLDKDTQRVDLTVVAGQMNVDLDKSGEVLDESIQRAKKYARLMGVSDTPGAVEKPKMKKKKFRYLSKTERKVRTMKERSVAANRGGRREGDEKKGRAGGRSSKTKGKRK